jgi:acetyl esterase/lipase
MRSNVQLDRRTVLQSALAFGALTGWVAAPARAKAGARRASQSVTPSNVGALFADLPAQSEINAVVDVYAATAINLARLVALTVRHELDISYGSDPWQKLDIYLPQQSRVRDLPVFLNIHGGGWTHGYKEWMALNAPPIVAFPAIYISMGYRLAPDNRHPAQLEDCLRALAWVHAHIGRYGGNPNRLFIGGHSAGAHLASLVTLRSDLYDRFGLPRNVVQACFPYNGIYDLRDVEVYGELPQKSPGLALLADATAGADASPIAFVSGNRTPFFVSWAENDSGFIKAQSSAFVMALRAQPGRVEPHEFERFDHFWTHIDQQRPESLWTRTLRAWMTGHCGD